MGEHLGVSWRQFGAFLRTHKLLWLLPVGIVLVWLVVLLALQEKAPATFEYRMF